MWAALECSKSIGIELSRTEVYLFVFIVLIGFYSAMYKRIKKNKKDRIG